MITERHFEGVSLSKIIPKTKLIQKSQFSLAGQTVRVNYFQLTSRNAKALTIVKAFRFDHFPQNSSISFLNLNDFRVVRRIDCPNSLPKHLSEKSKDEQKDVRVWSWRD